MPARIAGFAVWVALSGVPWQTVRPGVATATFTLATTGPLSHVRVIALRLDPCRLEFSFERRTRDGGMRGAWAIDSMPGAAVVAFNGGQFLGPWPWGWFVHDGIEQQAPGIGPLSMAVVVDSSGRLQLINAPDIPGRRGTVREAIQSYPTLLLDGRPPEALQPGHTTIDLEHRDTRLAIGVAADGAVIVAMTRFGSSGGPGGTIPYGPTIPEMAETMQRLGAVRAVGLDGGLSSQLAWRDAHGKLTTWTNWRLVPLGVVASARSGCGG